MRRAVRMAALLALALEAREAHAQFAPQEWSADQDGMNNACYDVAYFQANNMVGFGVSCVQVDNAGKMSATGTACGAGAGGVSSVTGTATRILATPTTGAVVVDLIATSVTPGSYTYAAFTVDAYGRLTVASSGATPEVPLTFSTGLTRAVNTITADLSTGVAGGQSAIGGTAAGDSIAILSTANAVKGQILIGPSGSVAYFDETTQKTSFGQASVDAQVHFVTADDTTPSSIPSWDSRFTVFGLPGSAGAGLGVSFSSGTSTVNMNFATPLIAWDNARMNFNSIAMWSGGLLKGFQQDVLGRVYDSQLPTNGILKTSASVGLHAIATAGTDYQVPLTACTDYVSLSCVSGATDLGGTNATPTVIGIENDAAMRGDVLATEVSTPSSPAAGKVRIYASTAGNISSVDPSGNINHGIRTQSCSGSQYVTGVNVAGVAGCAQPGFTDLSGSLACGQLPALTGADGIASTGGTCTVTNSFKGKVLATNADVTPDYLINKLVSAGGTLAFTSASGGTLVSGDIVSTKAPFDYVATYGGPNFIVDLPPLAFTGANPDFWFRPDSGFNTAVGGPANFATQAQVWDIDTAGTYGTVSLNAYVYLCAITTTGGTNDFTFTVTKNGTNTAVLVVATCPGAGTVNTNYTASGAVAFTSTDRLGIRGTVTNTGVYSSGALRATVHVRLSQ